MGLDNTGTKFLFAARAAGASFQRTATLGRQGFYPDAKVLQSLLDSSAPGQSAARLISDSSGVADKLLEYLGAEEVVAIDKSDYEGAAVVAEMNVPIDPTLKNRFTAIVDGGCLEHVFNFPQAIKNCMEMLSIGGHFIGITPANNFCGHGFYQFSPELFFRVFSAGNGFAIYSVLTTENRKWFRVTDPEKFGGRVEMQNNRSTYLFVLAKKIEQREIFAQPPQQSDYARQWESNSGAPTSPTRPARSFLGSLLPPVLKERLRPVAANFSIRHRYPCYRSIDEQSVLRGEFGN